MGRRLAAALANHCNQSRGAMAMEREGTRWTMRPCNDGRLRCLNLLARRYLHINIQEGEGDN